MKIKRGDKIKIKEKEFEVVYIQDEIDFIKKIKDKNEIKNSEYTSYHLHERGKGLLPKSELKIYKKSKKILFDEKEIKNKEIKIISKKDLTNKKLPKKISPTTKLDKILEINPNAGEIFFDAGMHCLGCGMSQMETLEQGCLAHGMSKKQIKELVERLNK